MQHPQMLMVNLTTVNGEKNMVSIIVTLMLIGSYPTVVDSKSVKSFDFTVFCMLPSQ